MTELLRAYRDDGPLARMVGARALPLPSLLPTALAVAAAAIGLSSDGSSTGAPSIVGIVLFVLLGMLGGAGRQHPQMQWLVPPMLRGGEYGIIAVLTLRAAGSEMWLAYAFLAAVAFHHYDIVYRLRHQRKAPPRAVYQLGGGWEGRTLVVTVAALTDALDPLLAIAGLWCGALFMSESMRSWMMLAFDETRRSHAAIEIEEEEV